jgi:hypothetical protein
MFVPHGGQYLATFPQRGFIDSSVWLRLLSGDGCNEDEATDEDELSCHLRPPVNHGGETTCSLQIVQRDSSCVNPIERYQLVRQGALVAFAVLKTVSLIATRSRAIDTRCGRRIAGRQLDAFEQEPQLTISMKPSRWRGECDCS